MATDTADQAITGTCPSCMKEARLSMCGRCGDIFYCSKLCQAADWPIHKMLCEKFAKFQDKQRPGADYVRCIVFPADRRNVSASMQRPRFDWVKKQGDKSWDLSPFYEEAAQLTPYNFEMTGQTRPIATQWMYIAQSKPWMTLPVPNRAIQNLGVPGVCFNWMGDIVVLGDKDINLRDFRGIVDWFQCYVYNKALLDPERFKGAVITGVKANCKGEMTKYNVPELQQVVMTSTMAVQAGLRSLGYLDNIMSLSCSSPDPHALWVMRSDEKYYFNRNSLLLMLDSIFFMDHIFANNACEDPLLPTGSLIFLRDDGETLRIADFRRVQSFVVKQLKQLRMHVEKGSLRKSLMATLNVDEYKKFSDSRND